MSNDLGFNSNTFLEPYRPAIRDVHKEICDQSDVPLASLDRFVNRMGRDLDGAGWSFTIGIATRQTTKSEVAAEYRRFLDDGRNCPEGSPGFARRAAARNAHLHASPDQLRLTESRAKFMEAINAVQDPAIYADAWNDYVIAMMRIAQQTLPALEALAKREADGEHPSAEEVRNLITPFEGAFSASAVFLREGTDTFRTSWEKAYVEAARAKFGNVLNTILPYVGLIKTGNPNGKFIKRIVENLEIFFEPFDHLHYSYSSLFKASMRSFLEVETPDQSIEVKPANPVALRRLIDDIVLEAGRVRKGNAANRITIAWDEATRTISFTDVGEGALALERFAASSGTETKALVVLAGLLGPGADIRFISDRKTNRLTSIHVVVPQKDAAPAPETKIVEATPPSANITPTPFSSVATIDEETKRMVEGTFDRLAPGDWNEAGASEQEEAIANVALYAQTFGESLSSIDDIVYRAALSCALSGTAMSLVRLP